MTDLPDPLERTHGGSRVGLAAMVARARAGDRDALATLFEWHEPMMIRWARRRLGQPLRTLDETRDILHEAYGIVLRKIDAFEVEDSRSFARWLRGIITRVVLQKAGSPYVRRRAPMEEHDERLDMDLTPGTKLSIEELIAARYRFLRGMDRMDRLIYRLRTRGCSSEQIADRVGMTDRAVRMRYAKTDARLRLKMQQLLEARRGD